MTLAIGQSASRASFKGAQANGMPMIVVVLIYA
jgi:hypothetical protein